MKKVMARQRKLGLLRQAVGNGAAVLLRTGVIPAAAHGGALAGDLRLDRESGRRSLHVGVAADTAGQR